MPTVLARTTSEASFPTIVDGDAPRRRTPLPRKATLNVFGNECHAIEHGQPLYRSTSQLSFAGELGGRTDNSLLPSAGATSRGEAQYNKTVAELMVSSW